MHFKAPAIETIFLNADIPSVLAGYPCIINQPVFNYFN